MVKPGVLMPDFELAAPPPALRTKDDNEILPFRQFADQLAANPL
jgi:hypothetical protein